MSEARTQGQEQMDYPLNGARLRFRDPVVTGREVLTKGKLLPASEHQLILVRGGRTRLVTTDEEVDLREEKGGAFRAFHGDGSFSFTLDEVGQVWGTREMDVDELIELAGLPEGHDLVLERDDEPDVVLQPKGVVSFGPKGVEDIVSRPRAGREFVHVTVFTTAGVFPAEGALRVRASTPIRDVLARAGRKLGVTDASTWVVTTASADLNPDLTFSACGLSGSVELEWGPREGGGG